MPIETKITNELKLKNIFATLYGYKGSKTPSGKSPIFTNLVNGESVGNTIEFVNLKDTFLIKKHFGENIFSKIGFRGDIPDPIVRDLFGRAKGKASNKGGSEQLHRMFVDYFGDENNIKFIIELNKEILKKYDLTVFKERISDFLYRNMEEQNSDLIVNGKTDLAPSELFYFDQQLLLLLNSIDGDTMDIYATVLSLLLIGGLLGKDLYTILYWFYHRSMCIRSLEQLQFSKSKYESLYYHNFNFIGRYREVNDLVNMVLDNHNIPVMVVGSPGSGKTATCKEVFWQISSLKSNDFSMPFVELRECYSVNDFIDRMNISIGNAVGINTFEKLLIKVSEKSFSALFFDDWEDYWLNISNKDRQTTSLFFSQLRNLNVKILIASCVPALSICASPYYLPPMRFEESKELFLQQWGFTKIPVGKEQVLDSILNKISGHALAIILTATFSYKNPQIEFLQNSWSSIELHPEIHSIVTQKH